MANEIKPIGATERQLSWSHFVELLPLKDELKRDYYFTLASANRWSVRQLRKEIDGMLYERTALSSKPEEQIELLQLDKSGIKVAQYMTELPPRNVLVQQIQKSLEVAKAKWGNERKEDEV
jgi:predicted nuclease of restriction endonuclease-like (RecB) superfamily